MPAQVPVPDFEVLVNGTPLPVAAAAHVAEVSVEEDAELPDMLSLEIVASEELQDEFEWVDNAELFSVGAGVEVRMGYAGRLTSLFKGEVTGLEPSFRADRLPALVVRGYDRRHRLMRGRHTRTFLRQTDSVIATQIALAADLSASVADSEVEHDYVIQANQTDYEFLLERAARINYQVGIEDKTLHFRPVADIENQTVTLAAGQDLAEFNPRLSSAGQASGAAVRGWDPKEKKEIVARAEEGDEVVLIGGEQTAATISHNAFGPATEVLCNVPVTTQAEADQMAAGLFNSTSLELVTGDAVCVGRADVRPGRVVKIEGVGKRFGGLYYVTSAAHVYQPGGYVTRFSFRRNAL